MLIKREYTRGCAKVSSRSSLPTLKVTGTLKLGTAKDPDTGFVSKIRIQANKVERAG